MRQRPHPEKLGQHLDAEEDRNQEGACDNSFETDQDAGFQEIKRREDRKGNDTHALSKGAVRKEDGRQHHADKIGREDRFALRRGRERTEAE